MKRVTLNAVVRELRRRGISFEENEIKRLLNTMEFEIDGMKVNEKRIRDAFIKMKNLKKAYPRFYDSYVKDVIFAAQVLNKKIDEAEKIIEKDISRF